MPSTSRVAFTFCVLLGINTMNFFDRQVLPAVQEKVRKDWGLSDTELGWLGTAFILLYAVVGLPLGRLADRWRRTWLLAVVRRASFDWLAKSRAWAAAASFDEDVHGPGDDSLNPESLAARAADRQLLRQALEELHPEFREAVVLRELEGLSYQQIAAVTGVPVGTVMSRLSRARKQLQRRLAPFPDGED